VNQERSLCDDQRQRGGYLSWASYVSSSTVKRAIILVRTFALTGESYASVCGARYPLSAVFAVKTMAVGGGTIQTVSGEESAAVGESFGDFRVSSVGVFSLEGRL
jgi:hypothetical protein